MKINNKQPSIDEMRLALSRLTPSMALLRDDADPVDVLRAAIEELVELRAMRERVRGFVQSEQREMSRR